jgi:Holliday junction resolvase-like predicted endonuclease
LAQTGTLLVTLRKQDVPHPSTQQVARAGEHLVAAELHRRGAYAVTFAGNMPRIDILASNAGQTRTVMIQVKTKRSGTWQASTRAGIPREAVPEEQRFWIFVDLRKNPIEPPAYYIVHEWWIQNDIHEAHQAYLKRAGGTRTRSPESTHHAIPLSRIKDSKDRWDRLGVF